MSERAKYSRIYWRVLTDDEFEGVRDSPTLFGSWSLMLIVSDMAWPDPAFIPPMVTKKSVDALVDHGLVALLSAGRFTIRGIDKERNGRKSAATRDPDGTQAGPKRDPVASPRQEEKRKRLDEDEQAAPDPWDAPETEALQWLAKHGCDIRPGNGYHRNLITLVEVHGVNAVVGMFDRLAGAGMKQGDTQGYVFGAKDALNAKSRPDLRAIDRDESAQERADIRSRRVQEGMWARRIERFRNTGEWEPEWGEKPGVTA